MLDNAPDLTGRTPGLHVYWTDQFGQSTLCRVLELSVTKNHAPRLRLAAPCDDWVEWYQVKPAEENHE